MKVFFVAHGNFCHIQPYLRFFAEQGHEVVFIRLADGANPSGVEVYDAFRGLPSFFPGKLSYIAAAIKARRFLKRNRPALLNAHFATSGGVAALLSGFRPYQVTAHGTDLLGTRGSLWWRLLLKRVLQGAADTVVVSRQLADIATTFLPPERVHVINVGIDTGKFLSHDRVPYRQGEPVRIVCTRRMEPVYDPGCIVEALALLSARGVPFEMTFVGNGYLQQEMEEKVHQKGLAERVRFLGQVPHESLPAILAEHDLYLSASRWDGTSLSLLEAMASGLFPIVTDIAGNESWIENGRTGFLFSPGDSGSLAACVENFVTNPGSFDYLKKNIERVSNNGDITSNMHRYQQLVLGVVQQNDENREWVKVSR